MYLYIDVYFLDYFPLYMYFPIYIIFHYIYVCVYIYIYTTESLCYVHETF